MTISLAAARAAASRRNGAKSCGPKTSEGKARSSQNALKHGFRSQKFVVVGDEKAADFAALEAALIDELAPDGALQGLLAGRIARAAWRLARAERIEAELFAREIRYNDLGLALIRDGNGAGAFATLLRYGGGALAELWRALRLLKALQAEAAPVDQGPARPAAARAAGRHRHRGRKADRTRSRRKSWRVSLPAPRTSARRTTGPGRRPCHRSGSR